MSLFKKTSHSDQSAIGKISYSNKNRKRSHFIKGEETQIRYLHLFNLMANLSWVEWPFKGVDFHQVFDHRKSFQLINQRPNKIKNDGMVFYRGSH